MIALVDVEHGLLLVDNLLVVVTLVCGVYWIAAQVRVLLDALSTTDFLKPSVIFTLKGVLGGDLSSLNARLSLVQLKQYRSLIGVQDNAGGLDRLDG